MAEWIDPATYATIAATDFKQTGATRLMETPKYAVDIALRIKRQ